MWTVGRGRSSARRRAVYTLNTSFFSQFVGKPWKLRVCRPLRGRLSRIRDPPFLPSLPPRIWQTEDTDATEVTATYPRRLSLVSCISVSVDPSNRIPRPSANLSNRLVEKLGRERETLLQGKRINKMFLFFKSIFLIRYSLERAWIKFFKYMIREREPDCSSTIDNTKIIPEGDCTINVTWITYHPLKRVIYDLGKQKSVLFTYRWITALYILVKRRSTNTWVNK